MLFSFGKAPFALLVIAVITGILIHLPGRHEAKRPDLVFALFAKEHLESYRQIIPAFEKKHGVTVQCQLVDYVALQSRLQAAFQSGSAVPDVVELIDGSMGYFTRGPLAEVGWTDLTERIAKEGIRDKMVAPRFSQWTSRGRTFAVPNDVHPVALAYRKDLVEQYGIDVNALKTWDDFLAVGRTFSVDRDGDGVVDRYMIDLSSDGGFGLQALLYQAGGGFFTEDGKVRFDDAIALKTMLWYVRAVRGPGRIAVSCGWGQSLARAVHTGLALFYVAPDWRTKQFEIEMPDMAGKLALMPLPAWSAGERRTSTWGGTGIAISKACRKQDLAWELVRELYLNEAAYGPRFASSNILPPVRAAWTLPELAAPSPYYSDQPLGRFYADLAPDVPSVYISAYDELARNKFSQAFIAVAQRFETSGEAGLEDFARERLAEAGAYVRQVMARNRFQGTGAAP